MNGKFTLLVLCVLTSSTIYSQIDRKAKKQKASLLTHKVGAFIDINTSGYAESNYTPTQLVTDVLISSGANSCFGPNVSNVQVSPNLPATDPNRSFRFA